MVASLQLGREIRFKAAGAEAELKLQVGAE
jgi:hypothetical protein